MIYRNKVANQGGTHLAVGNVWDLVAMREGGLGRGLVVAEVGRRQLEDGLRPGGGGGSRPLPLHCYREPTPGSVTVSIRRLVEDVVFPL